MNTFPRFNSGTGRVTESVEKVVADFKQASLARIQNGKSPEHKNGGCNKAKPVSDK